MDKPKLLGLVAADGYKNGEERAQQPGDPVQVVDTANVLDAQYVVEKRGKLFIAQDREEPSNPPATQCPRGGNIEMRNNAHHNATSEGRILDMDSLELVCEQTGKQERGNGTRAERQKGVDNGVQPLHSGKRKSCIEGWPLDPEDKSTKEGEDIRAVARCVVFVPSCVSIGQKPCHRQTKVGPKQVDYHSSSNINGR